MMLETMMPMEFRHTVSSTSPSTHAAQPMNTAAEYRFVTGGRPSRTIRKMRPPE